MAAVTMQNHVPCPNHKSIGSHEKPGLNSQRNLSRDHWSVSLRPGSLGLTQLLVLEHPGAVTSMTGYRRPTFAVDNPQPTGGFSERVVSVSRHQDPMPIRRALILKLWSVAPNSLLWDVLSGTVNATSKSWELVDIDLTDFAAWEKGFQQFSSCLIGLLQSKFGDDNASIDQQIVDI